MQKDMKLIMENWRKLIKEEEQSSGDLAKQIQAMIDENDENAFLKGKLVAKQEDMIESNKFVLLFSEESARHIAERHMDTSKPGSLFTTKNLRDVAKKLLSMNPSEASGGRVKWLGVNVGSSVGLMGVAKADPEQIQGMQDYQMPDGKKETVKIAKGNRKPTGEVSLITAELGQLTDGRKALSLITMFPGGMEVDGTPIPADRSQFAASGLYFVVSDSSVKENLKKTSKKSNKFDIQLKNIVREEYKKLISLQENPSTIEISNISIELEEDYETEYWMNGNIAGIKDGKNFQLPFKKYMVGGEKLDTEKRFVEKFSEILGEKLGTTEQQARQALVDFADKKPDIVRNIAQETSDMAERAYNSYASTFDSSGEW